jgi:thiamine-phosphate pyrophosphorylase
MNAVGGPDRPEPNGVGSPAPPGPVYAIADARILQESSSRPIPESVVAMARAGAGWIQLRAKRMSDARLYELAVECHEALRGTRAKLWVDDRPDVAALAEADGVHVGQADLPPEAVRRVVGAGLWIGRSTHDREQLLAADRDPAVDVIAIGPVFPTATKEEPDPVIGLELLRWARRATAKTLVAIGGIDASNIAEVLDAGADAVAVISAVCRGDVQGNVRRLCAAAETGSRGAAQAPSPEVTE